MASIGNTHLGGGKKFCRVLKIIPCDTRFVIASAAGAYAWAMAERGFAALAFDHRYSCAAIARLQADRS
jgi:hypothetical protein